jgi:hypothetical protein
VGLVYGNVLKTANQKQVTGSDLMKLNIVHLMKGRHYIQYTSYSVFMVSPNCKDKGKVVHVVIGGIAPPFLTLALTVSTLILGEKYLRKAYMFVYPNFVRLHTKIKQADKFLFTLELSGTGDLMILVSSH